MKCKHEANNWQISLITNQLYEWIIVLKKETTSRIKKNEIKNNTDYFDFNFLYHQI